MSGFDLIIQSDSAEPDAAEVLVDGTIGNRPYRFLMDTGAAMTSIIEDDYTAALEKTVTRESASAFSKSAQELAIAPDISLGPIHETNLPVARFPSGTPGRRNLIGMNLLKDHSLLFDFKRNRVEVDPPAPFPADALRPLTLSSKSHPYVELDFAGVIATAVWDSGAGLTVVGQGFIDNNPGLFRHIGTSRGTDSTGTSAETPMMVMKACRIGGLRFNAQRVAAVDLSNIRGGAEIPMDMILGYNCLKQAGWFFDFPKKLWSVNRD